MTLSKQKSRSHSEVPTGGAPVNRVLSKPPKLPELRAALAELTQSLTPEVL